jgi:hypothetical protein
MPIDVFKRKNNYFDINDLTAAGLDIEFNNIISYVNNNIVSYINTLVNDRFQGDDNPLLRNAFLINVGDNTLKFDFLKTENFEDNGLSLIKIENGANNSVLAVDNNRDYRYVTANPADLYQVLMSINGNLPKWDKLSNNNFDDRSITGNNVILGSITAANVNQNTYNFLDNSIGTIKFANNCVTNRNLQQGGAGYGLTRDRLSLVVDAVFDTMITSNMLKEGYLNNYFNTIFSGVNAYNIGNAAEYNRITDINTVNYPLNKYQTLGVGATNYVNSYNINNLQSYSINANRLSYFKTTNNTYTPSYDSLLEDGSIQAKNLTQELRTALDLQ